MRRSRRVTRHDQDRSQRSPPVHGFGALRSTDWRAIALLARDVADMPADELEPARVHFMRELERLVGGVGSYLVPSVRGPAAAGDVLAWIAETCAERVDASVDLLLTPSLPTQQFTRTESSRPTNCVQRLQSSRSR